MKVVAAVSKALLMTPFSFLVSEPAHKLLIFIVFYC